MSAYAADRYRDGVSGYPDSAYYCCLRVFTGVQIICGGYDAFLGDILGSVGKQFARLFFEGIVIGFGVLGAAAGTLLISLEAGLITLILVVAALTVAMMIIASLNFERMESVG